MSRKELKTPKSKFNWLLAVVLFAVSVALPFLFLHKQKAPAVAGADAEVKQPVVPILSAAEKDKKVFATYAGSESCRECHQEVFDKFKNSHHALAEQPIDPAKLKSFFEPARTLPHGTQTSHASLTNNEFIFTSADVSGGQKSFPIARVIGLEPLQQFLVAGTNGRFQTMELAIDPVRGDWFDVFGKEDRTPGEWGHWTGRGMGWNSMCASCHNTRLRKNYDALADTYTTTMVENRVGCEACHGPMREHNKWQRENKKSGLKDPTVTKLSRDQITDTCGSCHARRAELTGEFVPGEKFTDHFVLTIPDETDIYHADGQVRDEDYEFASFLGSKMHAAGVRCIDCHEPHSSKIRTQGNALCMTCHGAPIPPAPKIDASHSHHLAGGRGDNCVDCHMPLTTYMQRHERRDHGFTIPDPLLTKELNIPNACNRCHTDRTAEWSNAAVDQWYGKKMDRFTRHRAQVIAGVRADTADSHAKLLGLVKEEKHSYWRAVENG
ncbi:MAG: Tetratricopeptide repeat protein, partial [Verrucomicrobiales bacterium]|nr:Tetratricopeptide repeat protein [Verrucomicrobiales bacterium]